MWGRVCWLAGVHWDQLHLFWCAVHGNNIPTVPGCFRPCLHSWRETARCSLLHSGRVLIHTHSARCCRAAVVLLSCCCRCPSRSTMTSCWWTRPLGLIRWCRRWSLAPCWQQRWECTGGTRSSAADSHAAVGTYNRLRNVCAHAQVHVCAPAVVCGVLCCAMLWCKQVEAASARRGVGLVKVRGLWQHACLSCGMQPFLRNQALGWMHLVVDVCHACT